MKPIAICGFKNAGKTTLSKKLSEAFDLKWIDLDQIIESLEKKTIQELYLELGEKRFRERECETLQSLNLQEIQILSLGGGTVLYENSLEFLKKNTQLVYIETDFQLIAERILSKMPLWSALDPLNPQVSLMQLFEQRKRFFQSLNIPSFTFDRIHLLEDYVRQYFR